MKFLHACMNHAEIEDAHCARWAKGPILCVSFASVKCSTLSVTVRGADSFHSLAGTFVKQLEFR